MFINCELKIKYFNIKFRIQTYFNFDKSPGFEVSCKNYPEIEWCLKVLGSNMSKIAGLDRTIKQLIRDNVKMLGSIL